MNCKTHSLCFRVLAGLVCSLMVLQAPVFGQTGIGLTIQILEGDRVQNIVQEQVSKRITVRVMDRTGRPLQGASVQFAIPEPSGPGGQFLTNEDQVIVSTNSQGIASAPQFRANSTAGTFEIQVLATYMGEVTRMIVTQSNVVKKKSSTKLLILTAVAGGAAAAAFAARGGSPAPTNPPPGSTTPPTIIFQGSTIGAPQ